jgi:hypothetical protein
MVMLLSLVIPCSFCCFVVFPLFCLSRFRIMVVTVIFQKLQTP